jgi:hypothetical protein
MSNDGASRARLPLNSGQPKTPAERAKAYRLRKKVGRLMPWHAPEIVELAAVDLPAQPVTHSLPSGAPSRTFRAPSLLSVAAVALALVGITINGCFARSLGASDLAGWLFLAIGVAADLIALAAPSRAAALWLVGQQARAVTAWAVWLIAFAFAVTAGIGFASTNISDVTLERASRVTPAVTVAQTALADAMSARDRECKGGVGKFCREREAAVVTQREAVASSVRSVESAADPQTAAAIRLIGWASWGFLNPTAKDFEMFRLVLLALLPQLGGILLMVGCRGTVSDRRSRPSFWSRLA